MVCTTLTGRLSMRQVDEMITGLGLSSSRRVLNGWKHHRVDTFSYDLSFPDRKKVRWIHVIPACSSAPITLDRLG